MTESQSFLLRMLKNLTLRVTIVLQGNSDARKLETKSIKCIYEKIKSEN